ncbi:MAG TPA: hypothetical protein VHE99_12430 [Gammaproteobacteria bacterium]|nr:hypothetical protein [Gammaproteobacteria bacterium]
MAHLKKERNQYYRLDDELDDSPAQSPKEVVKNKDEKKLKTAPSSIETEASPRNLQAIGAFNKLASLTSPSKISTKEISNLVLEIIKKGNKETIGQLDKLIHDNLDNVGHPLIDTLTNSSSPLSSYRNHGTTTAKIGINKLITRILRRLSVDPGNEETQATLYQLSNTCGLLGMSMADNYDRLAKKLKVENL